MCLAVFIGSTLPLPWVQWNEVDPCFYIHLIDKEEVLSFLHTILNKNYYYKIGSHTGCSCGFYYGEWSLKSESDNHPARLRDVFVLVYYLKSHLSDNDIYMFGTWWSEFPKHYPKEAFYLSPVNETTFDFIEHTILVVKV